jgi:hypothetical protein
MAEWLKCDQCAAQAMWEAKKDEMSRYIYMDIGQAQKCCTTWPLQ